jgi:hypothetical protein
MAKSVTIELKAIRAKLDDLGKGEPAGSALKEAVSALTGEEQSVSLSRLMHFMRRETEIEVFDAALEAAQSVALDGGASMAAAWRLTGRIPLVPGYNEAKWDEIAVALRDGSAAYGADAAGLDERAVEYPWIFDRVASVHPAGAPVLDAGSVMNYPEIVKEWEARQFGPLSIVTLVYEGQAFPSDKVRYEYSDLRRLPYRDGWFSTVLSVSTLEHVGMDTAIYGGDTPRAADPEAEMALALRELDRVTAIAGTVLISVPFGASDDRGWLRILDLSEVERIGEGLPWKRTSLRVIRAFEDGWREVEPAAAGDAGYNEPADRPGKQTAPYWVAAAEAVALLEFTKTE